MSSALVSRDALGGWRHVRRYAVPPAMIAAATAARLAGDWRAACRAAAVDVLGDPDAFAPFAEDLRHLAPDLVRWHVPRSPSRGDTTIEPRRLIVLATDGDTILGIATPRTGPGTQRLTLRVLAADDQTRFHGRADWSQRRELWDARHAGELLTRSCGPRTAEVLALQDAGRTAEAWALAGVDIPAVPADDNDRALRSLRYLQESFTALDVDPVRVLEAARASGLTSPVLLVGYNHELRLTGLDSPRPRGEWLPRDRKAVERVPVEPLIRPVDLHLVRLGLVPLEHLHPLIAPRLAPFAEPAAPPGPDEPVRVRCGGDWHVVGWQDGRLAIPHPDEERRREEALRALGGELHGCFAAAAAWRDRSARLPRRLEQQRRDLMLRAVHGDVDGVVALLDAGIDPHARDPHGRTLLHLLPSLGPALLPRLLAAGLDVEDRDNRGRTPLHAAVHGDGSAEVIRGLLDAGARLDAEDFVGDTITEAYERHREEDLPWLGALLP